MNNQEASFYTDGQLNDDVPQKILKYFAGVSKVMSNEPVIAIFGSLKNGTDLAENSAVVLKDRIEYAETSHFFPKFKTVPFEFLDQLYLLPEGNLKYVSVVDKSKASVRFEIRSNITFTTAFYDLIKISKDRACRKDRKSKVVTCANCGASCTVFEGEETQCEYCGSPVAG